jgi:hypothetical protein
VSEQIKQVVLSYVTQRYLWWIIGFLALVSVPQLLMFASQPPQFANAPGTPLELAPGVLFPLGMPILMLLPFVIGQVKTQFAHPRAKLMPHFLPAHLAVLVLLLLGFFFVYPLLISIVLRCSPIGLLALTTSIGLPIILGAHFNRGLPTLISVVVFYSLLTSWGLRWWITDAAEHAGTHALTYGVCMAALGGWLWRLCHMDEEASDYENIYLMALSRRAGSEVAEQRRVVASQVERHRLTRWIGDWWHSRLSTVPGQGAVSPQSVLRYGYSIAPPGFHAAVFAILLVAIGIILNQYSILSKPGVAWGIMFSIGQFAILMPGQVAGEQIAQRRPRMANEILYPLRREQYFDAILLTAARSSLLMWLVLHAAIGIVILSAGNTYPLAMIVTFVLYSLSSMLAFMGIAMRAAIWPSMVKRLILLWSSLFVLVPLWIVWIAARKQTGDWPFALISLVIAGAAAWMIRSARETWLRAELG